MVYSVQQIKYEFLYYIKGLGGEFKDWYIGVSDDPEAALFERHAVDRLVDPWIYKPALTGKATFTLLRYFRDVLHTDGDGIEQSAEAATFAFAFRKSPTTFPSVDRPAP